MVHTFVATMRSGWPRLIRLRRPPAGDHADAFSRLPVVGDTRNNRRTSITAESSPCWWKASRIAVASALVTENMAGG